MTGIFVCSMRSRGTVESVAFDDSSKTFSLTEPSHIDDISWLKEIESDYLAQFIFLHVLHTELLQMISRGSPCLLEMAGDGFVDPPLVLRKETQLDGVITVLFFRLFL